MAIGDEPAEVVGINWPGGFHEMYRELDAITNADGPPDFDAMAAVANRHGATLHGPPLAVLSHS